MLFAAAAAVRLPSPPRRLHPAETKACWIYVGPIGDLGWTYQHHQGRARGREGTRRQGRDGTTWRTSSEADAERAIERLARDGCNIIFTTSFGFMEPTLKVAKKFPDVKFEHATGFKTADNVTTYNAKFHEGRYVIGQIAAKVSKTGVAGYIVSFPIPEVVAGINAFMLGAQSVNPDFKVKIVWVNTWYDPGKEADAAKVLFSQGADIIVQHTDSTAPLQVAEEQGKHGFGQASDMIKFAPKAQLTAIVDNWASLLRAPGQRRAQRHLEVAVLVGRHGGRHGQDRALHQPARRRREDGDRDSRERSRPASSIPSPDRSPSRTARWSARPASRCPTATSSA